ncbi:hypothetical protein BOTBODRAFT_38233 [Botryobasidium botryosum FD-172 SS1]|uniref:Uncharacterized protein n=1 Tax=Botryobasidium botryosum (strain FD-172 SS1) TaxID=930990 RepID=A0A067M958_BOTB1|nr:hypothetical protein BOTBODRAFT_38233 [Botryobasidium botryosum FD-172 SS1]
MPDPLVTLAITVSLFMAFLTLHRTLHDQPHSTSISRTISDEGFVPTISLSLPRSIKHFQLQVPDAYKFLRAHLLRDT